MSFSGELPSALIRIMCVDDHPIFRQGLAAIIASDPGLVLASEVGNGADALQRFDDIKPDITLMDLRLPDMNGIEVIAQIRETNPDARIIVVTTEIGDATIQKALDAGAKGYVFKDMAMAELLEIIHAVHDGHTSVPGLVAQTIAAHMGEQALSERETEVVALIAQGLRNKGVADRLSISEETVKMHVKNLMQKLNAKDRTHAVAIAIQRGFISV